jgi:hypothetical protein
LATEEDIASSFEELEMNDLFFFFGSFWSTVQDIAVRLPPQPSSQAPSATNLPGKRFLPSCGEWKSDEATTRRIHDRRSRKDEEKKNIRKRETKRRRSTRRVIFGAAKAERLLVI